MSKQISEDSASSCAFTYSDGRHCRMLRFTNTSNYCIHHARKLRHLNDVEDTASDLVEPIRGSFVSATALTRSLTRLFADVAEGRINAKDAVALARVANTLLKTIPLSHAEFHDVYVDGYYSQLVQSSFADLPPYILDDEENEEEEQHAETEGHDAPSDDPIPPEPSAESDPAAPAAADHHDSEHENKDDDEDETESSSNRPTIEYKFNSPVWQ